jgi:hypothetical protein
MMKISELSGPSQSAARLIGTAVSVPDPIQNLSRALALIAQGPGSSTAAPYAFRLPKGKAVDEHFGGTRGWWNCRILPCKANNFRPPIKSFVDKKAGSRRGCRFILHSSALEYFQRLAAEQTQPGMEGSAQ